jgi:TolB-like protein
MLYLFDDYALDTDRREVLKADRPIAVQPQVFDVLAFLIANRGRVVSKDEIIEAVWDGRVVSESTLTSRINAARSAVGDSGEAQRLIRTASRKGFRFIGAVRETASAEAPAQPPPAIVLLPAAPQTPDGKTPRLSIIVLPFANLGGNPDHDAFVDGVTESLTTDLSRIRGSFVIARHTAFAYKGKSIDLKQIGRELGVRYVLEGSILRSGERMRINAQLVDAETGAHVWADRFDKAVADLFSMQDEIVARIAGQLNAALVSAEARRAERSPHPDSMDFYFRGKACLNKGNDPVELARAQGFFSEGLRIDPENVDALVWTTFIDTLLAVSNFNAENGAARLAAAERNAAKALSLAPSHAHAHGIYGFVMGVTNRAERGIAECQHALELDPNFAHAHGWIGLHALHLGRGEETEGHIREALRLSPFDSFAFAWFGIVGFAKNSLGRYEEAINWLRQGISRNGRFAMLHFHLGSALAYLGRMDEARAAATAGLALDPTFNLASFRAAQITDDPYYLAWRERVIEGMRMAGVPDG